TLQTYTARASRTIVVNTPPSGPYSPPLQTEPAFHSIVRPVNFIVSPLRLTPNRGSVKFQPKWSPMGSHKSPLRRKAHPNRTPNPVVLTTPSEVELGFMACIAPNTAAMVNMVVYGPQARRRTWKP